MNRTGIHHFLWITIFIILLTGCQSNPGMPSLDSPDLSIRANTSASNSNHYNMGFHALSIKPDDLSVEVIPMRASDFHLNLTGILNTTMGVTVVMVPGESDPENGLIVMDITLSHPFETKTQFAGFDVKGVLITPGSQAVKTLMFAAVDETRLTNADGYTRWWNPVEFTSPGMFGYTQGVLTSTPASSLTATVNPYKYFADILYPTSSLASVANEPLNSGQGRGVFTAGSTNTRRYNIQFEMDPGPQIVFGYAVDVSWDQPVLNPPANIPGDFPIEANQPEPWRVAISESFNSLYYDTESGTGGGMLKLTTSVFDWQGQQAGDIQPEVNVVRIYAPDILADSVDSIFIDQNSVRARYEADTSGLLNITGAGEVLVVGRIGSTDGSTYDQVGSPAPDAPLSAYAVAVIDIIDPECSADTNNDIDEAVILDLENPTIDQLCAPTDYRDFYELIVPPGNLVSGSLTLFCDAEPTSFAIYDLEESILIENYVSDGSAEISLDSLNLKPGTYPLRVLTQTDGQAFLYTIEPGIIFVDTMPSAVDVTPDDLYFDPETVGIDNDLMVCAAEGHLWLYDISDVSAMEQIWHMHYNLSMEPVFQYPYIYAPVFIAGNDYRIHLIDITDPQNPVITEDILTFDTEILAMIAEPGYLYVVYESTPVLWYIDIFDIATDPTSPSIYNGFSTAYDPSQLGFVNDAASDDYWLVILGDDNNLEFWEISDKDNIGVPFTIDFPGNNIKDFDTINNYVYLVRHHILSSISLFSTVHVTTGAASQIIDFVLADEYSRVEVGKHHAWIGGDDGLLSGVDITTPDFPVFVSDVNTFSSTLQDPTIYFSQLFTACEKAGVRVYDAASPAAFEYAGEVVHVARPSESLIHKNHLYIPENQGIYNVIKVLDLADPSTTDVIFELLLDHAPRYIAADGDYMIAWSSDELMLIDCSDPANLVYDGWVGSGGVNVSCMAIRGDVLYFGTNLSDVETWDISGWPAISNIQVDAVGGAVKGFEFKDQIMYVHVDGEIQIFSVSNPQSPAYLDTYTPLSEATAMQVDGDYLYVATTSSLEILDISTPQTPVFLSSTPHPDSPHGEYLAVEDLYAICQPYWTTPPTVFSIWPPDSPAVVGPLYGAEIQVKPNQVLLHDGYYYETASFFGVRIWDLY